jgi:signal peptidase I
MKLTWRAQVNAETDFPLRRLQDMGVHHIVQPHRRGDPVRFESTEAVAQTVETWPEIATVEAVVRHSSLRTRIFPYGSDFGLDNYGPLYIPQRGDTLVLDASLWDRYRDIIIRYEGHQARKLDAHTFEIDGDIKQTYIVEQDYYFVMGDNRDSSLDSRAWGFVPRDHIVGKALLVYFSWDHLNNHARTDRIMTRIR